jgi:hypothetical protein
MISLSGSSSSPCQRLKCAAVAWRSSAKPIIGGYWFQPLMTASAALRRTSSGPGSSGKPWPRLTAPVSRASRDMTSKTLVWRDEKIGFMAGSRLAAGRRQPL